MKIHGVTVVLTEGATLVRIQGRPPHPVHTYGARLEGPDGECVTIGGFNDPESRAEALEVHARALAGLPQAPPRRAMFASEDCYIAAVGRHRKLYPTAKLAA